MNRRLIVVSDQKDPYMNHTIEEILFTSFLGYEQILFLWVNAPVVVFGRNQNPWKEVALDYTQSHDIQLIRRLSGGGTVYHDTGNLNYSVISRNGLYDEAFNFDLIKATAGRYGLNLTVGSRKELTLDGAKVSGSAFYMKGMRRLHHGTLLIDSDLNALWKSLKVKDEVFNARFLENRGVASVSSPVMNLSERVPGLKVSDFLNTFIDVYYQKVGYDVAILSIQEVISTNQLMADRIYQRHQSWDWVFGETPPFKVAGPGGEVFEYVKPSEMPKGIININF